MKKAYAAPTLERYNEIVEKLQLTPKAPNLWDLLEEETIVYINPDQSLSVGYFLEEGYEFENI